MNSFHDLKLNIFLEEFERRKKKNSSYSQRAFARDLKVSHTLLSLILSAKRNFSRDLTRSFVEQSILTDNEKKIMLYDPSITNEPNEIDEEFIKVIACPNYYTILGLVNTPDFRWEADWIAFRVGISLGKAKILMTKMRKFGIVKKDINGKWVQGPNPIRINNKRKMEVGVRFNKTILKKASESLVNDPFEKRHLSSIVMTIDESSLDYAVKRIRDFRLELSNELEAMSCAKEVYTLAIQLFPLTKDHIQ